MKPQPPVPEHKEPSKGGYGHPPSTKGHVAPQRGSNAIGPDDEDAGTSSHAQKVPPPPAKGRDDRQK